MATVGDLKKRIEDVIAELPVDDPNLSDDQRRAVSDCKEQLVDSLQYLDFTRRPASGKEEPYPEA